MRVYLHMQYALFIAFYLKNVLKKAWKKIFENENTVSQNVYGCWTSFTDQ